MSENDRRRWPGHLSPPEPVTELPPVPGGPAPGGRHMTADDWREAYEGASANGERLGTEIADVLHDCLSSFQGLDHSEGVCCFDRDAAVEYLLSPASGLTITVEGTLTTQGAVERVRALCDEQTADALEIALVRAALDGEA